MKQKDKPYKLYLVMMIVYTGVILLLFMDSGYLKTIVTEALSPRTSRLIRDINLITFIPQGILLILVFIRAVGFNIKKFNFSKDIEELQIDVSDNEEFEITIGTDSGKIRRIIRKNKRELKYFYLEHKGMIIGIITVLLLIISYNIYYNLAVINKIYNQNEIVRVNNISYKIDGLYSSNLNYRGEDISEKDTTFLILSMRFYNGNKENIKITTENMRLVIENNIYLPISRKYESFKDLGYGYKDQIIKGDTEGDYIFVYKVLNKDLKSNIILRYADDIYFKKKGIGNRYIKYYVDPISVDEISTFPIADFKKEINYSVSNLKETKLTINNVEFKDKYSYNIGNLIYYINDPMDNRMVMKISYNYIPDASISYIDSFQKFLKEYGTIRYEVGNKKVTLSYSNLTPTNYKDNDMYLSVPSEVLNSNSIELVIKVRNKVYIHKLK
jgi:hypothetical protein